MRKFSIGLIAGLLAGLVLATTTFAFAENPIKLLVNGQQIQTDVPPQIINGRVMVPARFIAEPLGAKVDWYDISSTVSITIPQETFTPIKSPQITGPDNFTKVIQESLRLSKEKDPVTFAWIASNLNEIKYETNPVPGYETTGAYVDKEAKICYIVSNNFNKIISSASNSEASLLYVGILAHETSHICLKEARLEYILNKDDEEVVCNIAGLRAMEKAGGTELENPIWFFKELIKKDLKL